MDSTEEEQEAKEVAEPAVTLEVTAYRAVLKNRGFLALWIGQGISGIGDWVIVGVLLDQVNRMAGASGLAWMMAFRFLPAFLFGLLAGAIVDRLERKTTMIFCEIARAVLVVVLAFSNSLAMICVVVFSIESFSLVFGPAKDASIPNLVKQDELMTANSLMSTTVYLTMALGTMIATVLLGLVQLIHKFFPIARHVGEHQAAFFIDALTFLASAALIFTIVFPKRREREEPFSARKIWNDMIEGLKFMWRFGLTRTIMGAMIIGFIGGGSLYILVPPFAENAMNVTGAAFTLILTILLVGVVVGSALSTWLSRKVPKEKGFGPAIVFFGLDMVLFSLIDFYVLSLMVIFIGGMFLGYLIVTAYTLLQQNLEDDIRGRAFAAVQTIMRTCLLFSMGIFAGLAALLGRVIPKTGKSVHLLFFSKTFYPSMLAMILGGLIVIVGGLISTRSMRKYIRPYREGEVITNEAASTSS